MRQGGLASVLPNPEVTSKNVEKDDAVKCQIGCAERKTPSCRSENPWGRFVKEVKIRPDPARGRGRDAHKTLKTSKGHFKGTGIKGGGRLGASKRKEKSGILQEGRVKAGAGVASGTSLFANHHIPRAQPFGVSMKRNLWGEEKRGPVGGKCGNRTGPF